MKSLLIILLTSALSSPTGFNPETSSCKSREVGYDFKEQFLSGTVQVVQHFGQFKVKVVTNFADLEVEKVKHATYRCGEWELVDQFGDFTIEYVTMGEDFTISFKN